MRELNYHARRTRSIGGHINCFQSPYPAHGLMFDIPNPVFSKEFCQRQLPLQHCDLATQRGNKAGMGKEDGKYHMLINSSQFLGCRFLVLLVYFLLVHVAAVDGNS